MNTAFSVQAQLRWVLTPPRALPVRNTGKLRTRKNLTKIMAATISLCRAGISFSLAGPFQKGAEGA